MRDVEFALASLKETSGLAHLDFNAAGKVELVFNKTLSVILSKVDATQLELVSYLSLNSFEIDTSSLVAVLHANFLGQAVGGGRLAVDPEDNALLYCERVDVAPLDASALEKRVLAFVKHATFWNSAAADKLVQPIGNRAAPKLTESTLAEMIIRG